MTVNNGNGVFDTLAEANEFQDFLDRAMEEVVSRRKHPGKVDEDAITADLEMLLKTRLTHDIDLLRAVAEHGAKNRATTIASVMGMLREGQSGDVSHLVTEDVLTTHELVLGVCVLVRWNSDQGMHREDTDQIVKHAVVHAGDAHDIVEIIKERNILQYDGIMAIMHAMRANPAPVLAAGTL
jgi:hypothetical protein